MTAKLTVSAEKSLSISVKTFFFFFGDHLSLGGKNVRISDSGPKITLSLGEDIRIFEGLCLKSPPPKFSRSATGLGPPPIKNPGYAYEPTADRSSVYNVYSNRTKAHRQF